jgi:hypothetical protein
MLDQLTIDETYTTIKEFIAERLKWLVIDCDMNLIIVVGIEPNLVLEEISDLTIKDQNIAQAVNRMGREYPMIEMAEFNLNVTHRGKSFSIDLKDPNAIEIIGVMIDYMNGFQFSHAASPLLDLMHQQLTGNPLH